MKLYISGKITSLSFNVAKSNFDTAEQKYASLGYDVVNPMSKTYFINRLCKLPWIIYMIHDVYLLLSCNAIYLQPNWKDSKGSIIEYKLAKLLNYIILFD